LAAKPVIARVVSPIAPKRDKTGGGVGGITIREIRGAGQKPAGGPDQKGRPAACSSWD
jgi:hypothetical protein